MSGKPYKLLVTDINCTLINKQSTISDKDALALKKLIRQASLCSKYNPLLIDDITD